MTALRNRQVLLASRPTGEVREENFRIVDAPLPTAADGEVLVRNRFLSLGRNKRRNVRRESRRAVRGLGRGLRRSFNCGRQTIERRDGTFARLYCAICEV